jgi:RNA polymerase sigma-70 factor, ECF subfamily
VAPEIERLYREHRDGLVRLVERELHDHHDAEDVVQTAFLDAQRALERGTIPRNSRAWLAAIALNAGRHLRRRRLNAEPLEEYAVEEISGLPEIRAALATLPREQRAAVVYRDLLGLSYGETAEKMGTSVNAVTMLLHRGRSRLRQTLGLTAAGIGVWRWLKQAGMQQAALVKGAAAVAVAAGLAGAGIVVARVVPPSGTQVTAAAQAATSAGRTVKAGRTAAAVPAHDSTPRTHKEAASRSGGTPAVVPSSTAETMPSLSPATLTVPTVSAPRLPIPTSPVTVPAGVTVSTPVAAVTVTTPTVATPTGTTAAVTTPITTVTLPLP